MNESYGLPTKLNPDEEKIISELEEKLKAELKKHDFSTDNYLRFDLPDSIRVSSHLPEALRYRMHEQGYSSSVFPDIKTTGEGSINVYYLLVTGCSRLDTP